MQLLTANILLEQKCSLIGAGGEHFNLFHLIQKVMIGAYGIDFAVNLMFCFPAPVPLASTLNNSRKSYKLISPNPRQLNWTRKLGDNTSYSLCALIRSLRRNQSSLILINPFEWTSPFVLEFFVNYLPWPAKALPQTISPLYRLLSSFKRKSMFNWQH